MKITIENYERYALDFLEGHLGQKEEEEFQKFLDENPDIMEELQGIDEVVLIPDMEIHYPHKANLYRNKRLGIIPLWKTSRLIAAAVTLLLITATVLFIRNTTTTPAENLTDNQPPKVETPTEQNKLPAIKTPMPAEQPVASVMARKGNASDEKENIVQSSPALNFGSRDESASTRPVQEKNPTTIHEDIASEPVPTLERQDVHALETNKPLEGLHVMEEIKSIPQNDRATVLALLPVKSAKVDTERSIHLANLASFSENESSSTFEIRIPGQFLSETWTDVSLSTIKDQILPEFLKNRQNL